MTTATILAPKPEAFYLQRFNARAKTFTNGRKVDDETYCEIYKGFAIVTWKQVWESPQGGDRESYTSFVWECGGAFDHVANLAWLSMGTVTSGFSSNTFESALAKVKKKVDLLSIVYSRKRELQQLASIYVNANTKVFNASVNDVVVIRAFARPRLGIVIGTTGSRFIVAYMTPSNPNDCHYKVLPLSNIYSKD